MPSKLNAQARLKLIERAILKKEPVAKICRENGISRVIFYRWLKRYLAGDKNSQTLAPKVKTEASVANRVTQEQEAKILEIIIENPALSCRGIFKQLPLNNSGKPIVGYHGVQNVLTRFKLSTKEQRIKYGQNISKLDTGVTEYNYLSPEQKQTILNRVLIDKEQVTKVCQEYGLSRTAFYKLKNRYLQVADENKENVLVRKKPQINRYWRQTPEQYENAVLDLVSKHPEYGIRNLLANLPQIGGVPIVSHHGIQNILKRNDLSLYEQRLAYAKSQVTPFTRFIQQFEIGFGKLFVMPQETRAIVVRFVTTFSFSTLLSIVILGGLGYLATISGGLSVFLKPGMFFASLSLLMGTIFLSYSMKYYFSLALVLSFSSQENKQSVSAEAAADRQTTEGLAGDEGIGGWVKKIFGSAPSYAKASEGNGAKVGGLEANLDHIKLERYPFISIHLPFYNEKKVANRIISACTSMDYPNFEVIVCDDSTDETVDIINEWKNHPRVRILHRPTREGFKGGALRFALRAMDPRTEFVCVFDADFVPYPDSLIQFVKYFKATGGWSEERSFNAADIQTMPYSTFGEVPQESQVPQAFYSRDTRDTSPSRDTFTRQEEELRKKGTTAVVAGYQWHVLNKSENWITRGVRTEYSGSYVIERPAQEIVGAMKIIHGSVYCMRADVLKHFGWGTSITEDYEMTLRIYEKGFRVCYTPYIQAPSECVSTIKRLIRQRMRWAEGHSFNTRKMFGKLLFGKWEVRNEKLDTEIGSGKSRNQGISPQNPVSHLQPLTSRRWVPSPLTFTEKLEFLYMSPYYLQAFFFIIGTMSWLLSEVVFRTRLPFWTSLWGWSLVLTNFFAMPLLNGVGLFLEEAEEKDYLGTLSFVALSYLLVPFQAYAAVKGFVESREGPWFRTPKTGTITDVFTRGRFYRWLTGILNWKPTVAPSASLRAMVGESSLNPYLALVSANNRFSGFTIKPKKLRWFSKFVLAILLCFSVSLFTLAQNVSVALATNPSGTFNIHTDLSTILTTTVSHQLEDAAANVACDTGQSAKHAKNIAWRQIKPDVNNNVTDPGTPCPASATGTGWIFQTQFGSNGYISDGAWNFYLYTSDNAVNNVGNIRACIYRVQISGTALGTSTKLFEVTGSTDVWVGGALSSTITTGASPCGGNCTFTSTENYLYTDFYIDSNNGANSATAAISFGEEQCGTTPYVRIVTPTVQIPEKVVFFLAAAPFIPMMVLWIKKRKAAALFNNEA